MTYLTQFSVQISVQARDNTDICYDSEVDDG